VFKVLALVPLIMLMLVFAVATSVTATIDVRAYNMLLAIVSPQMGYLFGILVLAFKGPPCFLPRERTSGRNCGLHSKCRETFGTTCSRFWRKLADNEMFSLKL
jgi:hypothetical protein